MINYWVKESMSKQTKITRSAKGEECQIRIPGVCNFDPSTTVLAHLNGGGMGMKHPDWMGSYSCSACHDAVDARLNNSMVRGYNSDQIKLWFYDGVMRTQKILFDKGLIIIK